MAASLSNQSDVQLDSRPVFPATGDKEVDQEYSKTNRLISQEERNRMKSEDPEKGKALDRLEFRGFGQSEEPSPTKEASPEHESGKRPFQSFGRGDLSRDFNDRSR